MLTPAGEAIQDSTPILERFEAERPEPGIHPGAPVSAFVSALLEEFGDEWGNEWMFHYRWARDVNQIASAGRIARAKPEPDLFLRCLQRLGLAANECHVVGDAVWVTWRRAALAPSAWAHSACIATVSGRLSHMYSTGPWLDRTISEDRRAQILPTAATQTVRVTRLASIRQRPNERPRSATDATLCWRCRVISLRGN